MLAQLNLYPFLKGRRRLSRQGVEEGAALPGYDSERTAKLQEQTDNQFLVGFIDGSYLEFRSEVGTWVAFHERWERK